MGPRYHDNWIRGWAQRRDLVCPGCGERALWFSRESNTMSCGECGYTYSQPCPTCGRELVRDICGACHRLYPAGRRDAPAEPVTPTPAVPDLRGGTWWKLEEPDPEPAAPELLPHRVGDAERNEGLDHLQAHYAAGRLTAEEFETRQNAVLHARTKDDIVATLADLPVLHAIAPAEELAEARKRLATQDRQITNLQSRRRTRATWPPVAACILTTVGTFLMSAAWLHPTTTQHLMLDIGWSMILAWYLLAIVRSKR